jgi:hypothetical protein
LIHSGKDASGLVQQTGLGRRLIIFGRDRDCIGEPRKTEAHNVNPQQVQVKGGRCRIVDTGEQICSALAAKLDDAIRPLG